MIKYICFSFVIIDILFTIMQRHKIKYPIIHFYMRFAISFLYVLSNLNVLSTNIFNFVAAIIIGYLTYLISCFIVGTKLNKNNLLFINIYKFQGELKNKYFIESSQNIIKAFLEEIVYRGILHNTLNEFIDSKILVTIIVTLIFIIMHNLKRMALVQILDLIVFSIVITSIYTVFSDLIMVSIIHITRNWYIINQKYSDYFIEIKRKEKILKIIRRKNHDD